MLGSPASHRARPFWRVSDTRRSLWWDFCGAPKMKLDPRYQDSNGCYFDVKKHRVAWFWSIAICIISLRCRDFQHCPLFTSTGFVSGAKILIGPPWFHLRWFSEKTWGEFHVRSRCFSQWKFTGLMAHHFPCVNSKFQFPDIIDIIYQYLSPTNDIEHIWYHIDSGNHRFSGEPLRWTLVTR